MGPLLVAVPRVSALFDKAAALLTKADALIEGIEETRAAADDVVRCSRRRKAGHARASPLTERLARLLIPPSRH